MRLTGHVKWYNDTKGLGCISPETGEEIPVRSSAIQGEGIRSLEAGQRVEFDLAPGPHGPRAARVIPIGDAATD